MTRDIILVYETEIGVWMSDEKPHLLPELSHYHLQQSNNNFPQELSNKESVPTT